MKSMWRSAIMRQIQRTISALQQISFTHFDEVGFMLVLFLVLFTASLCLGLDLFLVMPFVLVFVLVFILVLVWSDLIWGGLWYFSCPEHTFGFDFGLGQGAVFFLWLTKLWCWSQSLSCLSKSLGLDHFLGNGLNWF